MATTQTFGAATSLGSYTGFKVVDSSNPSTTSERGAAHGETGNETASQLYNEKTDYTAKYEAYLDAPVPPDTIGALVGSAAILTSIGISTSNKAACSMDLSGHNHADNAHTDKLLQALHAITITKWWGAEDFLGGTGGEGATVLSGTITITCDHQDVEDEVGDHAEGQNSNGMITATTVWQGAVTTPAVAGWDVTQNDVATSSTGVKTTTVTGTKAVALSLPA